MEETGAKKFVKTKKVAILVALLAFAAIILGMGGAIIAGLYFRNEETGSVSVKITTFVDDQQQGWPIEYGLSLETGLKDFVQHNDYQLTSGQTLKFVYEIENIGGTDVSWKILLHGDDDHVLNLSYQKGKTADEAETTTAENFSSENGARFVQQNLNAKEKCVVIVCVKFAAESLSQDVLGSLAFSIAAVGG